MMVLEIQNERMEYLKDHAEKLVKHSKKLLECLEECEEMLENEHRYAKRRKMREDDEDCEEYSRYR